MMSQKLTLGLLIGSAAVNLLVAGAIVGAVIARTQHPDSGETRKQMQSATVAEFNGASFFAALPAPEKQKARQIFVKNRKTQRQNIRHIRQLKRQIYALLREDDLDRDAVISKLAELRQAEAKFSERGQLAILEVLVDMDSTTRARVVREMRSPRSGRR